MRLIYFTDTFLPEINGVTTVLATMRDGLRRRGHEVQMVAPGYGILTADEAGLRRIPGIPCPGYPAVRLSWPWLRGIPAVADAAAPDLVHAVTEGPIGALGRGYALKRRIPLVTSFHTDFPRYAGRYLGNWAVKPVREYLRWFHRPALATQTPSAVTRAELQALGLTRAMVWGRGVDARHFTPDRRSASLRAELGATERTLVLHVGRLAVEKDPATVTSAFRQAHEVLGDQAVFCVAGDGPEAHAVREGLPFARHLGFLSRERLADLYAAADLFVFPSATETCGLVALEALASGLPVIGAEAGGVRESVIPDITGALVAPEDGKAFAAAIVKLVRDSELRLAMSQAARAFAVGCSWDRELDQLEALYGKASETRSAVTAPMNWPTTTSVT